MKKNFPFSIAWWIATIALLVTTILGSFRATSARDSRITAERSTQECQRIAKEIREARRSSQAVIDKPVQEDQLFAKLIDALRQAGLQTSTLASASPVTPEKINKGALIKNSITTQLTGISQKQLLAFLNAAYSEDLPLVASQISFQAAETESNSMVEEVWDVKLLLTYFVRSTKSPQ